MAVVPASARWLAGVACAVFVVPLVLVAATYGVSLLLFLCVVGLLTAAVCAVPVFYRRQDRFRVACAAAGFTVAGVWLPLLVLALLTVLSLGGWASYLTYLLTPVAAITALIAAFQRARGTDRGRVAVVLAWSAAAASMAGWILLAGRS
ncbi:MULTISPECIES: hypothetical protein [Kitasatospora]|uniref:Uncharacterized protein n=1 Tax=Kitasatospora cathayae TaxID=3004092 RepID=A0ABY7QAZ8_9ACTN|nr:hypothetical protein [Kitasatospora sp. HUAS 3-15]WBP89409.1 hypothetical protein O1G21_28625 [Kitasatospora sp. HUAS 3-15]